MDRWQDKRKDGQKGRQMEGQTDRPYLIGPFQPRLGIQLEVWSEYYNQFAYIRCSHVSLSEPQQNNVSNPEEYVEPC